MPELIDLNEAEEAQKDSFWREPVGLRIAVRQAALFLLVAFGVLGLLSIALYQAVARSQAQQRQQSVELLVQPSLHEAWAAAESGDAGRLQLVLNELVASDQLDFAVAYDAGGDVVAHTFEPFFPESFAQRGADGWGESTFVSWLTGTESRHLEWSQTSTAGSLRVGFDRSVLSKAVLETLAPFVLGGVILLPLAALVIFAGSRRLSQDAEALTEALGRVADGEQRVRTKLRSTDLALLEASVRDVARSAGKSGPQIAEMERERAAEKAELQANINRFLGVATEVAMGDLTRRGQVSADVLGNVVDAINVVIERMDDTLIEVRGAVQEVSTGSDRVMTSSTTAEQAAREQLQLVQQAEGEVTDASDLARAIAAQAQASSASAASTSEAAGQGRQAVQQARSEMEKVRQQVSAVSRRIKSLGERSLEVSEIAESISSISYQTNLLAVNAAIEASGAGEAGQRFSVVAEEVRRLAEDTSRAARKIDELVSDFQPEVQAAVTAMDQSSREVEEGFRAAELAEASLGEIETFSGRADGLAKDIAEQAGYQTEGMTRINTAVQTIASQSRSTLALVSEGQEVADKLHNRANGLLASLLDFTLSEAEEQVVGSQANGGFAAPADDEVEEALLLSTGHSVVSETAEIGTDAVAVGGGVDS